MFWFSQMAWAGPAPEMFLKFYGATTKLDMKCLYCADHDVIQEEFDFTKEVRVLPVDAVEDDLSFHDLLLPLERTRLNMYEAMDQELVNARKLPADIQRIHDLQQNPSTRPRSSPISDPKLLPSLISHGTLWNSSEDRWLLTLEWGNAQAFPTLPSQCPVQSPIDFRAPL